MSDDPRLIYAAHLLEDAANRIKWQHEFALAGIRSLILINGGAIIALLTYIGSKPEKVSADAFKAAFIFYALGLCLTISSYLFAYWSQGMAQTAPLSGAMRLLGFSQDQISDRAEELLSIKRANVFIALANLAAGGGIIGFAGGSYYAMIALR